MLSNAAKKRDGLSPFHHPKHRPRTGAEKVRRTWLICRWSYLRLPQRVLLRTGQFVCAGGTYRMDGANLSHCVCSLGSTEMAAANRSCHPLCLQWGQTGRFGEEAKIRSEPAQDLCLQEQRDGFSPAGSTPYLEFSFHVGSDVTGATSPLMGSIVGGALCERSFAMAHRKNCPCTSVGPELM